LHTVRTLVPAVAEAAGIGFILGHVAFKIGAGQVVEQHVELRAKEIAPTLAQMGEEPISINLIFEQIVEMLHLTRTPSSVLRKALCYSLSMLEQVIKGQGHL
jgi:hypothetical protein